MVWAASLVIVAMPLAMAADRGVPSDVDLKASYCMGVLNALPRAVTGEPNQPFIEGARAIDRPAEIARERLRAYMVPKLPYLDQEALVIAGEQGRRAYVRGDANVQECVQAKFLPF